ncbi:hypothetical protein N752_11835 [Desulforamulus aquiferis]|nr:HYR domain-containing protein [Desulforamulus aquiferis]RYD04963.1 hypothetical protein N752_11835 [Desulforamulus aquiferis]
MEGAGIYNRSGNITIKNSIVANNVGPNYSDFGTFSAVGINFDTDGTCPDFTQVSPEQLKLGSLELNPPGITETHALLSGSIAIDKSTNCTDLAGDVVTMDQRGVSRPQNSACDVGAYEFTQPPTIIHPDNITIPNNPGQCRAKVDFTVTAIDSCSDVSITCKPVSGSFFPVGTTQVNCTAKDECGNTASCSFSVNVVDNEPPAITCSGDITVFDTSGLNGARVNFTVMATDNCPGVTVVSNPPSGSFFPLGTLMSHPQPSTRRVILHHVILK